MRSPVVQIGCLLTLISLAVFIQEPFFIRTLSRTAHDVLIRHHHIEAQSDSIVVVDLDEASLNKLGQWPWPRYQVAKLVRQILDAGARVVALDIIFPEADRTSPDLIVGEIGTFFDLAPRIEGLPEGLRDWDQILADTLSSGNTILGCYLHRVEKAVKVGEYTDDLHYRGLFYTRGDGHANDHLLQADRITTSIPILSKAVGNNAFFNSVPDFDGVVRRAPLVIAYGETRMYPSLALEAVRMFLDLPQAGIEHEEKGIQGIRLKDRFIPTDLKGRLVVNYRTTPHLVNKREASFPIYSAGNVLNGKTDLSNMNGKIVFIGTSAVGLRDLRSTPLKLSFPGVEINATIADNILAGDVLQDPRWMYGAQLTAIFLVGLLLTFSVYGQRSWLAFFEAVVIIGAAVGISILLFKTANLLFIPSHIIVAVVVMYPVLTMISYWQSEREMRWVRSNFGAMVSDKVLEYIEANPASVTEKGKHTDATIMFSDIEGFTSIAERLGAEEISELMDIYMNPMTKIIMRHDGYIDKYIGDMIMAEWGVPFPLQDHAMHACQAALDQLDKLHDLQSEFQGRFGCSIKIRMGINSGDVIAGNMGSEERHQYTVLGDAVNLASRLEPLNKEYGTTCLISEQTFEQCKAFIEARKLDRITVEGKTQPVWIYELLGRTGKVSPRILERAALYEKAYQTFYTDKDATSALELIDQALVLHGVDVASLRLKNLITEDDQLTTPNYSI